MFKFCANNSYNVTLFTGCGNLFDNGVYYIQSAVSGNVVDVNLDSPTPGSEVQVSSTFENRTNQLFYIKIVPSRPDTFMILNVASNLAIDVGGSATLEVPTCTGTQLFSSVLSGNDNCYIYSIPVRDYIILYNDNDILSTIILRGEGQLQNQWLFQNITPNCNIYNIIMFYVFIFVVCAIFFSQMDTCCSNLPRL